MQFLNLQKVFRFLSLKLAYASLWFTTDDIITP